MSDENCVQAAGRLKLLNCAHCGAAASVRSGGRETIGHGESAFVGRLGCSGPLCGVHISIGGRDDAEVLTSLIDASVAWNTRR